MRILYVRCMVAALVFLTTVATVSIHSHAGESPSDSVGFEVLANSDGILFEPTDPLRTTVVIVRVYDQAGAEVFHQRIHGEAVEYFFDTLADGFYRYETTLVSEAVVVDPPAVVGNTRMRLV